MGWKSGALAVTIYLLMSAPARPQISSDGRGSPCADLLRRDSGRPAQMRRATAKVTCSRPSVVGTAHFREGRRASACHAGKPIWVFKWRGFPNQAPIVVDAQTVREAAS
jgi:hypothetical protein